MNELLTLALAKGRLAEKTFDLLEKMGIDCSAPRNPGRQLVLWDEKQNIRFILVKPSDVPTYVDHGVADLGVVGKDTLMEAGRPLYEVQALHSRISRQNPGYSQSCDIPRRHQISEYSQKLLRRAGQDD